MKNVGIIIFTSTGSAKGLWTEAIPLQELGTLEINRASQVEFNPSKQEWEVRLMSDLSVIAYSHRSREICLQWERDRFDGETRSL